ncbi:serine racemase VanT catalytic subunit [Anaerocolumna sp. MB42-C2]|uniref:serine racemase VanT catalytic subunit n=1 Tax=Anaerocolumna sp. MB42-C2 TaxID=3070997 RepID=UPI0027E1480B|nr:serine racemase VanT catalytic subunit [Anaerocolumna sp. MB42-C2]WMJ88116.1 serine racemase VanT catalytic subunit [Anaerocolumna sp. MB42-C2]
MNPINPTRVGQTNLIKENYDGLDYFRMIAAFLIVAIHTSPLTSLNTTADFVFTRIIARVAVPFFFMVTGFFILSGLLKESSYIRGEKDIINPDRSPLKKYLNKTTVLYGIAMLLYIPVNLYNGYFKQNNMFLRLVKDILFNGTMYHLWYLPAVILGVILVYFLIKISKGTSSMLLLISILLYLIGLLGDSYYGITSSIPVLKDFYDLLFQLFDYTRNGIFYAPIFLVMGACIACSLKPLSLGKCITGLTASSVPFFIEGLLLHANNLQRHDSMYLFLLPCMYFLFQLLLHFKGNHYKNFRTISMIVYIIHPFSIILVRGFAKVLSLERFLVYNSLLHYLVVSLLSLTFGYLYIYATRYIKQGNPDIKGRAWIEINLNHLRHNVREFQSILPKNCILMAVVKANAYGHGDVEISKGLNKIGVSSFAVATLSEGVDLRKRGIKGEILIFGYTHPQDFKLLVKYRLIQTVVDLEYAQILNHYGSKLKVHIKIDTGMHRLGENYTNLSNLEAIFKLKNLIILGTYTHLSVSDSLSKEDTAFTKSQIEHFYRTIQTLVNSGYNPGKLHIQSSYGVLNYPELSCDYARIGIALYGVLSSAYDKTRVSINLKPVLSVKARIVMIKTIEKGDAVSYGRTFTASKERIIATVTIGYADGIPRNLENGYILVKGSMAPIIGRICMDQLMIDITDIPGVVPDEIVTVIGINGTNQIKAEEIATNSHTITNELLTRLGNRLKRIYVS